MQIFWEKLEHEWRKQLLADAKGNILEIGVGTGENFKYYPADVKVTAVDTSAKVIEQASKEAKARNVCGEFIVSCIDELKLPENHFDTIVSTFSLSSFNNPLCVLKQFNKWCTHDGTILLL